MIFVEIIGMDGARCFVKSDEVQYIVTKNEDHCWIGLRGGHEITAEETLDVLRGKFSIYRAEQPGEDS